MAILKAIGSRLIQIMATSGFVVTYLILMNAPSDKVSLSGMLIGSVLVTLFTFTPSLILSIILTLGDVYVNKSRK
jgi:ABC-type polysaccharide/polyol phosphate export permease